jgi:GDP-4-dehydro-6-deoxy-D-mannose reductase
MALCILTPVMRVLITGINGFVGGHFAEHVLSQAGWDVWGLTRTPQLTLPALQGRVQLVQADLNDRAATRQALAAVQPALIVHLAGQAFVPESFRDPAATLRTNTFGALHLFLALIDEHLLQTRVLVVGTNEEYGQIRPDDLPVTEQTPLRPTSPYGVSKAAQSLLTLQYHLSHGLDLILVRPFTHIGPRQNERFVTAAFARQIARIEAGLQEPVLRVGNLEARRDFTDVRDIVRAYTLLLRHGIAGETYNVGSGRVATIQTILDMLLAESTTAIEVRPDPALMRPIDIPLVYSDCAALQQCTGWAPQIPLEQTLHDVLQYWRAQVRRAPTNAE